MLDNFTDAELAVIDRQGWNARSLVQILSGYDPADGERLFHLERVAALENVGEVRVYEDLADVPVLLSGGDTALIGKTIQRTEYVTVPGPYDDEPGITLHFTDGTAHTIVMPADE